nr:copia protein [Tanacetum cinerariifolium]
MKTSTNMAWNLGSRMSGLNSLRVLLNGKFLLSGSVTPTLALTDIQANVKGENATISATEEPPSHIEGETKKPRLAIPVSSIPSTIDKGKGNATESDDDPLKKLVKASSIVRPDIDKPKAEEEVRLNAISKIEVIKVVHEEAKKLGIHPKEAISTKAGELFKKAQDAEHVVLKRQHTEKVRKSLELRKHKNFDVHKPFLFGAFGISELDELREIIPKKKNTVVKDLMNSLSRRYERLRQIPGELKIQFALPALEQASSQNSERKQKHMKLEPEIRITGLECNRTLPENVPFVNNMVIEEPEYGFFFTDEFGDQVFQRWIDIDKVRMETLVSYLVDASMVKSLENAGFNMKLRKLIAEHPDQEKLKSKKVKLEALRYNMD